MSQTGIGNRIHAIRTLRGILSAKDLAAQIPGNSISEAIVRNIAAGSKRDPSFSPLLNCAKALRVSPIFLLTPIANPLAQLDIPNLSPVFVGMTFVESDAWISGEAEGAYAWATRDERSERTQLEARRELYAPIGERRQQTTTLEAERLSPRRLLRQSAHPAAGVIPRSTLKAGSSTT